MMKWGACKCCEQLKSERDFLRSLINTARPPKFDPLPIVSLEADAILSGNTETQIESLTTEELDKQAELDSERSRLLAGTY